MEPKSERASQPTPAAEPAGLCAGTRIMTQCGHLPVEFISAGDRLITRAGLAVVRHRAARRLNCAPVLVRRGALGPRRPMADIYLAPGHPVRLAGWSHRFICGSDTPLVPISRLADGRHIVAGAGDGQLMCYELELDRQSVIYAEGIEVINAAARRTTAPA